MAVLSPNLPVAYPRNKKSKFHRFQCGVAQYLDTSRWIKIEPGLDDFRHGAPDSQKGNIIPLRKCIYSTAAIFRSTDSEIIPSAIKFKRQAYVEKQVRRDSTPDFQKVESTFDDYDPFTLLPILERTLPYDVFKKLCDLLHMQESDASKHIDPLCPSILQGIGEPGFKYGPRDSKHMTHKKLTEKIYQSIEMITERKESEIEKGSQSLKSSATSSAIELIKTSTSSLLKGSPIPEYNDPYRQFLKYGLALIEKKKKMAKSKKQPKTDPDLRFLDIAEDFCKWASEMEGGEEILRIDPATVMMLFAVDQDHFAVVTDMKILDSMSVPQQLLRTTSLAELPKKTDKKKPMVGHKPRQRYGVWYLDVNQWKKLDADARIIDPEEAKKMQNKKKQMKAYNEKLRDLYITKKFHEHLMLTKTKPPHFLASILSPKITSRSTTSAHEIKRIRSIHV